LLGPQRQATRNPVFKDVAKLWSYDFSSEEKKRFKGIPVWIPRPDLVSDKEIDDYLRRVAFYWPPKTGMTEEIALCLLMRYDYSIKDMMALLESSGMNSSYEIVQLINKMTGADSKIEFIGYLNKLSEMGLDAQLEREAAAKELARKGRK